MKFSKMHGAGNDYVYVDCVNGSLPEALRPAFSKKVSARSFGVGSDGLICICPSDIADFKMDMYNLDGSQGKMCGNGIRCVGKFVYDKGLTDKTQLRIETLSGIKTLWLNLGSNGTVDTVRVDMGRPNLLPSQLPMKAQGDSFVNKPIDIGADRYFITAVSVGNPHIITFVEDVESLDLPKLGPLFERHPMFPEGVNTEFIQVIDSEHLKMRVWERGSGETLACGTGATASVVAATLNGKVDSRSKVSLPGGDLFIEWDREEDRLYMTGPAVLVFDGELREL